MFVCSGYMSPEYTIRGLFSEKSDVFSFGVLLLKIVSGRRNTSICDEEQYLSLAGLVNLTNNIHNIRKFSQTLIKSYFIYLIYLFIFDMVYFQKDWTISIFVFHTYYFSGMEIVERWQHYGFGRPNNMGSMLSNGHFEMYTCRIAVRARIGKR